SHAKVETDEE
nr:RecName: Full=Cytochrome c oxidase subunit 5A, mitochondrial; AltName: Full=Cytochrome c oxidase polypeptide Va [Oncorhynchus mykiss]